MPTPTADKPTLAEIVRRRRAQRTRQRYEATTQAARTVRPVLSRPRVTGTAGATPSRAPSRLALPRLSLPRIAFTWRALSFALVALLVATLARVLTDSHLFVEGINLGGAALVPGEEIYAASGVARQHIFWIDPVQAQNNVAAIPGLAAAHVEVRWPNIVTIVVEERAPVILWLEGGKQWWVDAHGQRFTARGEVPGLLPIALDEVGQTYEQIPLAAIEGALQLRALRPNIELLHYDTRHGLSYQDGRNWRGYFGVGADMPQKLAIYETLVNNLLARGFQPAFISVENLKAPYYRK